MTIGAFLPQMVEVVFLFLLAAAALPDSVPAEGIDLKLYYDRNGPYFWGLFSAVLAWQILVEGVQHVVARGSLLPLLNARLGDLFVLAAFVSLIFVRNRWWHAAAFLLLAIGPVTWLSRNLG